ncbi:MAG: hypothetical protein WEB53_02010 [Akkermansiaceae bacterium]
MFALTSAYGGGFTSIFSGKDLTGWKANEETPGCFKVEDGAIKVSGGRAHLLCRGGRQYASGTNPRLGSSVARPELRIGCLKSKHCRSEFHLISRNP